MVALLKTTQIQEPSSATVNIALDTSGGATIGQNLTVTGNTTNSGTTTNTGATTLTGGLAAGTASVAPLKFASGTNLTTATAGAVEYDGKVFYGTPQGTQRGVIPGAQFFRLNADLVGTQATTAQNAFGVGVTLSASTVYAFQYVAIFNKTAGTTSHSFSILFGGTATLNNIMYGGLSNNSNAGWPSGQTSASNSFSTNAATALQFAGGVTSANRFFEVFAQGTVSVNAGGTFIPQYILGAAPGGAYSTVAGSYFLIYPISASGANTSVGTWA